MKRAALLLCLLSLSGCAALLSAQREADDEFRDRIDHASVGDSDTKSPMTLVAESQSPARL